MPARWLKNVSMASDTEMSYTPKPSVRKNNPAAISEKTAIRRHFRLFSAL